LSRASAIKVGQVLGAREVVIGSIDAQGDEAIVRARIIRLDTGRLQPEAADRGPIGDPFPILRRVARALRPSGSGSSASVALPSPEAFAFYVRGLTADSVGDRRTWLEQAIKAAPDFEGARLSLWSLHTEQGAFERALGAVSAAGGAPTRDLRYAAALSLISLERFDEAFSQLKQMQTESRSAVAANALGVVQLRRGSSPQTGLATHFFSQAAELDPAEPNYRFNLDWLERDAAAAIYWLREAVRRDPADGGAHFLLAAALHHTGAGAEAAREAELARRLSSRYAEADIRSDAAPRGLERLEQRRMTLSAMVDAIITSSSQRDQQALAEFHLDAGRRALAREADQEAEAALRRAVFLSPYLADAHLLLGRLHLRASRPQEAAIAMKIALWSEESAEAHAMLAEALLILKDLGGALEEVDRALRLDPTFAPALALREKLR
jgi:Flp pilus assembly protein TadD